MDENEIIKSFVKKNRPQFLTYKKYVISKDWSSTSSINLEEVFGLEEGGKKVKKSESKIKADEFKLQDDMMSDILDRVKFLCKRAEGDHHRADFKKFIKECFDIIDIHTGRTEDYVNYFDVSKIENQDVRTEEMAFIRNCFSALTKLQDKITALNIKDDSQQGEGITFFNNKKAPLAMHEILVKKFPEIQRRLDTMEIDFTTLPKNEMLIHMENVPKWNEDKHYWEQEKETLQFYVDEFKKIHNGIMLDGKHIHPWLYYHINIFTTAYPSTVINKLTGEEETRDIIGVPPLRDNEYFMIQDSYVEAEKTGKMVFYAASRRVAKTTALASHCDWKATDGKRNILCAGGATKDLDQIEGNFKTSVQNKNPAFRIPNIDDDWTKKVNLGLKGMDGKNITASTLHIVNLNKGGNKASEILAGYTPDAVIIDELMKLPFMEQLAALKPAIDQPGGKRCVVILSGTSGNEELAKDAFRVLADPVANDILPMDWKLFNSRVPLEDITWIDRDFGTFIPAQMSAKEGLIKIDSNLAAYLKLFNSPELEKVQIKVTDWATANKVIHEDRDKKKKDHIALTKEVLYHPIDPEEMLQSTTINPFYREEALKRKEYLLQSGKWDRRRLVRLENGILVGDISTKPLAVFPHRGGNVEAPIQIYEDIPTTKPVDNLFVASFDDVKQDNSDTDSVISFQIWKMENFGDEWGGRLVLSWACRPENRKKMYAIWLLLQQTYNAKAFPENEDMGYNTYLENLHLEDMWLIDSIDFTRSLGIVNTGNRKKGWMPKRDKKVLMGIFLDKMNDFVTIGENENGEIKVRGVELVDDIGMLDEIINYREDANVDRISSALGAVGWMHYLKLNWITPKIKKEGEEEQKARVFQKKLLGGGRGRVRF